MSTVTHQSRRHGNSVSQRVSQAGVLFEIFTVCVEHHKSKVADPAHSLLSHPQLFRPEIAMVSHTAGRQNSTAITQSQIGFQPSTTASSTGRSRVRTLFGQPGQHSICHLVHRARTDRITRFDPVKSLGILRCFAALKKIARAPPDKYVTEKLKMQTYKITAREWAQRQGTVPLEVIPETR